VRHVENMPGLAIYGGLSVSAFLAATILPVSSQAGWPG
jgi:membrane protein YqaA with SNARE-associated domain